MLSRSASAEIILVFSLPLFILYPVLLSHNGLTGLLKGRLRSARSCGRSWAAGHPCRCLHRQEGIRHWEFGTGSFDYDVACQEVFACSITAGGLELGRLLVFVVLVTLLVLLEPFFLLVLVLLVALVALIFPALLVVLFVLVFLVVLIALFFAEI